ncbi:MAG: anti-sigma factor [Nocardioides sp.]|uniref:anti-sigma factor n=1 Tax=Nocardioides sp. TaxID=35761 RepID=UPI0039E67BEB
MGTEDSSMRADVELRLPAEGAYVSVLRTTTAGLAARLDFTLDDIEDLRMAVGEAAAIALEHVREPAALVTRFWLGERRVQVQVETVVDDPTPIDEDSFAWQVLTTLADSASATLSGDRLEIVLVAQATPLEAAL